MNRFNFLYVICFLLGGLLCGGCSKEGIDTFDESLATVTVPWNSVVVLERSGGGGCGGECPVEVGG